MRRFIDPISRHPATVLLPQEWWYYCSAVLLLHNDSSSRSRSSSLVVLSQLLERTRSRNLRGIHVILLDRACDLPNSEYFYSIILVATRTWLHEHKVSMQKVVSSNLYPILVARLYNNDNPLPCFKRQAREDVFRRDI